MSNLLTKTEKLPKEEYDKIPVHYCNDCLSLSIRRIVGIEDACYCDKCGSTNIAKANIKEWESLYREKHGFTFLDNTY